MLRSLLLVTLVAAAGTALAVVRASSAPPASSLAPGSRCFELRTYTAPPGKLEALHARFRDHTNALFVKHGMTLVGYWVPRDKDKGADNTLVYVLAYPDCAAREKAWEAFRADPAWIKARDASEAGGKLVEKVDSVLMTATDYSPMK
jgi:NIPSNAP protein